MTRRQVWFYIYSSLLISHACTLQYLFSSLLIPHAWPLSLFIPAYSSCLTFIPFPLWLFLMPELYPFSSLIIPHAWTVSLFLSDYSTGLQNFPIPLSFFLLARTLTLFLNAYSSCLNFNPIPAMLILQAWTDPFSSLHIPHARTLTLILNAYSSCLNYNRIPPCLFHAHLGTFRLFYHLTFMHPFVPFRSILSSMRHIFSTFVSIYLQ